MGIFFATINLTKFSLIGELIVGWAKVSITA